MEIKETAKWFLEQKSMTPKKLQKLCYYAQAWHCALYNTPLFESRIEAWVHGPVSPVLYREYAKFKWNEIPQINSNIKASDTEQGILESVLETYGEFSGDQLEALTHSEQPWIEARGNAEEWQSCTNEITIASMQSYYYKKFEDAQGE